MEMGVSAVPLPPALQQVIDWCQSMHLALLFKQPAVLYKGPAKGTVIKLPCHNQAFLSNSAHNRWRLDSTAENEKQHLESRQL